jgi:hypothetical protein
MDTTPPHPLNRLLLFWSAAATLIATAALACCLFLFTQLRHHKPQPLDTVASPFLLLQDDAVAGRYKWSTPSSLQKAPKLHTTDGKSGGTPC